MLTKFTYETIQKYFEEQSCKLTTSSEEYVNTAQTLHYICSCGNSGKTNYYSFRKGSRCSKCASKKRKQTCHKRYGVECNLQLQEIIDNNIERTRIYKSDLCANQNCRNARQGKSIYCKKHGGGYRCEVEGCKSSRRAKDRYCVRHGGGDKCNYPDCLNSSIAGFKVCVRHGGGRLCAIEGCNTRRVNGTHCLKHASREYKDEYNRKRKERRDNDPVYRMVESLRTRVRLALNGNPKHSTTMKLIGCSVDEFKRHIETQFMKGMTWDNYGEWEIDHIKPCSSFDMTIKEEQKKCFHYSNTQPLWKSDNASKSNREYFH